jgi:hypothetical protein
VNDPGRLAAVRRTALLDTPAEESFDQLTRLACRVLNVQIALVSLVEAERQFFKSCIGLAEPWVSAREAPLSHSFCRHVVALGRPVVIDDVRTDPIALTSPVEGELGIVAYAGVPLRSSDGHVLGTLAVISRESRTWHEPELQLLEHLAGCVLSRIELEETRRGSRVDAEGRAVAIRQLLASERRLATIVESALDAMITMDARGAILSWNPQAVRVFGWETHEVVGQGLADTIIPPGHREAHRRGLAGFLTTGSGPILNRRIEVTALHRSGREIPVELTVTPVRLGDEWTFSAFVRDMSERRELESRLRQSQRMEAVGQLAGGIAHDFNNLLTAILGNTELALTGMDEGAEHREEFEAIRHAAERAAALTQKLLALSRRQVLKPRLINLNDVVRSAEGLIRPLLGEQIDLATELSPELNPVRADPAQIEQVILSLAVNARDAMPDRGRLRIRSRNLPWHSAATPAGWVELSVSDTGVGMDPLTRTRVFEPFFTTKGTGKGTGLGLSTAYGVVTQSGGAIAVESEPGKGATFSIRLPAAEGTAEPLGRPSGPMRGPGGNETILLVEDEPALRAVARRVLEGGGYRVVETSGGEAALTLLEGGTDGVDLLLTDVIMPGMSGPQLAARVREILPGLRVQFMTGYSEDAVAFHGKLAQGTACLQKPFSPDRLLRFVRESLDAPAPEDR